MQLRYNKSRLRKRISGLAEINLGRTMLKAGLALMTVLALSSVIGSAQTFISSTNVLEIDGSGVYGVGGPISSTLFTAGGPFDAGAVNWYQVNVGSFSSVGSNDTVVLFQVNTVNELTPAQKATLVSFVTGGGKLIIWDSDAGATTITPNDYSWLPANLNFNTSVPGQLGASGGILTITEENDLSSNISSSPKFINTFNITQFTDAVGDANIVKTNGTDWCQDMFGQNAATPPQSGPAHMYSRLGSSVGNGFIVYSALDWDFASFNSTGGDELRKMLQFELEVNHTSNLPCKVPVVAPKGSISGMKFNDLNGNGTQDAGEPGLANWTITLTNDTGVTITQTTASDGSYNFTNLTDGNYTVGEVIQPGWTQTAPATGTYNVTISGGNEINGLDFGNKEIPPTVEGRMTGGGSVFNASMHVTHGFELNCNASKTPNNLEVNWGKGNKFHLDNLTTASCSDNPAIEPNPPNASFDTYSGTGTGRYNGASGATAEWTFTDAGEPGNNDTAKIIIKDSSGNIILSVSGNLIKGNHQAHNE